MDIREDDLTGDAVRGVIRAHLDQMVSQTPAGSVYALDLSGLTAPDVTFWSMWDGAEIIGCGALKELDPRHGEIKSMHTLARFRGQGYGRAMLTHILTEARHRGYRRLSLETGATGSFAAAQALYRNAGFTDTGPFGGYTFDPHSVYLTLELN
ncbi:MAG: GNAT family N-acetyltransferase [Alphaproteobacteria bacterium]